MLLIATVAVGLIVVFLLITTAFKMMWKVVPPNEALIVSGGGGTDGRTFKIVTGGGTFVIPGLQTTSHLGLNLHEANLKVQCPTSQGVPVVIEGVCIYKIANDAQSITNAASRFLNQESTMDNNVLNLLDGHLRAIIGTLTVENLLRDRASLTDATRDTSKTEVEALGLAIESLQIKNIGDPTGYIENLAKPHIAEVQQLARIAQAKNDQIATIAEQEANAAKADAQAQSQIKQAQYQAQVKEAQAISEQQGPLATARAQQEVITEQTKITVLQAAKTAKQLEVDVQKPADAEAYKIQKLAEGKRAAQIAEAEGQAAIITQQGNAEAAVIKAKALAEADGIEAKARALATNQEAVVSLKLAETMPQIIEKAAEPFSNVKDLIVTNGGDGLMSMITSVVTQSSGLLPIIRKSLEAATNTNGKLVTANDDGHR